MSHPKIYKTKKGNESYSPAFMAMVVKARQDGTITKDGKGIPFDADGRQPCMVTVERWVQKHNVKKGCNKNLLNSTQIKSTESVLLFIKSNNIPHEAAVQVRLTVQNGDALKALQLLRDSSSSVYHAEKI